MNKCEIVFYTLSYPMSVVVSSALAPNAGSADNLDSATHNFQLENESVPIPLPALGQALLKTSAIKNFASAPRSLCKAP
jgi:hypothetical protein